MILSDFDLWNYIRTGRLRIDPFTEEIVRENGVDLRIGNSIGRLKRTGRVLDTRSRDTREFYEIEEGENFIIMPHEHVLLHTVEYLSLPRDLMAFVNLRSSFARVGLTLPPTIVDAHFQGQLTIELVGGEFPVRLYANDRFIHLVFAKLSSEVDKAYQGKYQGQRGVKLPSFD
ncbi:MAG: dCTP deaminase [Aigarchaeota archaeon]|nr:dCTP deaminase [Aigarchaeota archaeon]MDW8092220.1 dCTP deaminase [Nitrososphaerota archaeon]